MQLSDYLAEDFILPDLQAKNKPDVLSELIQPLAGRWPDFDLKQAKNVLQERERLGSTGIGDGVAIPHGKMDNLENVLVVVGRSNLGVEFDALDKKPCYIFFLVLAPEEVAGLHLRILAHVSRMLKDESFRQAFLQAEGRKGLWDLLSSV
jgi:PTS system nitrogen regulatory IIA component